MRTPLENRELSHIPGQNKSGIITRFEQKVTVILTPVVYIPGYMPPYPTLGVYTGLYMLPPYHTLGIPTIPLHQPATRHSSTRHPGAGGRSPGLKVGDSPG